MNKLYKIYGSNIEQDALDQFHETMAQSYVVQGACMPDAHKGYTLNIGGVVACKDVIVPSYVGFDIGCGMCAIPTDFNIEDVRANKEAIRDQIFRDVPTGFARRKEPALEIKELDNTARTFLLDCLIRSTDAPTQLGTMGGNNHFIEIGYDESNTVWIVTHSGSRNLGKMVAEHYMKIASGMDKACEGHFPLYVNSIFGRDYITDLNYCLEFALLNRRLIVEQVIASVCQVLKVKQDPKYSKLINRNHNHAELKNGLWIHRKGATHADRGMLGVIPGNMRDGSFIVEGLGNPDSLCSSSHGAGRVRGRNAAQKLDGGLKEFEATMSTSECSAFVGASTIEEAPGNYKDIFEVMQMQKDLVKVIAHINPLVNIKAKKMPRK